MNNWSDPPENLPDEPECVGELASPSAKADSRAEDRPPTLTPPESDDSIVPDEPGGSNRATAEEADPGPSLYTLDRRMIRAEQTGDLIFTAVLFAGSFVWIAIRWSLYGMDVFLQVLAVAALLVVGSSLWFSIYWPIKTFRYTRWGLDDAGLEIRKGVLWRHRIIVPITRVQHADVSQGPLQRAFDLGTLTVHTAGTSNASVDLAGLNHAVAVRMRDHIVRARSDRNEQSG